ncbi:MAG: 16S rRNA (guanine(527)-N(7))-methyltransferase RsmG [Pirellulaceae bacterium]|jgi:16S rRNA (guanine527-N7)-methyltransferase|nr:16S rRNA (guanine(527)-N(7))-methyltransferase RsmG [Pirellulaceae bacterium]
MSNVRTAMDDVNLATDTVDPGSADMEANEASPSGCLQEAAERVGIDLPGDVLGKLEDYCTALWEWNTKINLTRHTNYDLFARRDLLDSVKLAEQLSEDEEVLDVGTGGGVPGIPLAILRPDLTVSLCDSVAKKTKVVKDIVKRLELPVAVHATRVQDVLEDLRFNSLVTRAVGNISQLLGWLDEYWMGFDRLLAIKGPRWVDERGEARHRGLMTEIELRRIASYTMPGTESESVILQMNRRKHS